MKRKPPLWKRLIWRWHSDLLIAVGSMQYTHRLEEVMLTLADWLEQITEPPWVSGMNDLVFAFHEAMEAQEEEI